MTNPTSSTAAPGALAGRREWTAFLVLLLPLLLVSMDISVLFFAIPSIDRDLAPSATQQLWIFDVYAFALAGLLITMGSLGDRIGRRRLLLIGALAFGAASVCAAYANSPEMLIAARAVLGIGGATLMPSTIGLVRNMFRNEQQRAKAIGIWSGAMAGGVALGSVLSGVMLEHFWWGSVFLINVPAMLLLLILVPLLVPEFKDPNPGRFDFLSVPLSMGTVLPVVYGIKESAAHGLDTERALIIAAGLLVGWVFVRRQRTRSDAMISRELFRGRGFGTGIGLNALAAFAMMGSAFFTTQYLQSVLGMSTMEAALWSLAPSLAVGAAAPAATAIAQRTQRAYVVCAGFVIGAAGFGLFTLAGTDSLVLLLIGSAVMSSGIVAVMALVSDMAMAVSPAEKAGSAASLLETGQEFGGALGMALLGAVSTAVYRADMPASAPDVARKTLPGALTTGDHSLIAIGQEAFVHSMRYASVTGSLILLTGAVLAATLLRRATRPAATAAGETATEAPAAAPVPARV
ncbi:MULTISPECIES: MFS transporter [unclassified Streptomyces]|uniref:MFS transporter n=1 Tax=unclassified Streptomyces TaxID=2593676 RepID=UPI002253BC81|nr:MFS transporter [Streptomyces sp. NBC_01789]MCX4448994.1 MFS transporter [Streptomyces sp. NBC_01789]